jgi:hypothetical protein
MGQIHDITRLNDLRELGIIIVAGITAESEVSAQREAALARGTTVVAPIDFKQRFKTAYRILHGAMQELETGT